MHLDLSDEETAALLKELHDIVENDPYPFSPRIRTLRAILNLLKPELAHETSPLSSVYAPPSKAIPKARPGEGRARTLSAVLAIKRS
jgi:hypothetical protein